MASGTNDGNEILAELREIFRDILDQPDLLLTPASNASNVEDWDSLAHINLLTTIEKEYKIRFALNELQDLKDVGDMMALIQRKLASP
jgi:acyl carrier protein